MREFTIPALSDGINIAVAVFEPAKARGIVQLVHGMCEHKERYYAFAQWLADHGYICVIHDHRGHGASIGDGMELGYMGKGGWKAMVDEVKLVGDMARKEYGTLPFTLFGHSMGAMVVRSYAKRYDSTIDRLIVCGSPSDNPVKGVGKALAAVSGTVLGWHHRSYLLHQMSFGVYNRPFKDEGFSNAWVCRDKEVLTAYHEDPLCHYIFTANGFYNLLGLMQDCYSVKGWKMEKPELSVRFISGGEDACRVDDKSFAKAVQAMRDHGYSDVESHLYPDMRHEILNDVEKIQVWNDVLTMIR